MNQSSPMCVLYLSDASNNKENEENGRMKIENSDTKHIFSVPQIFFYRPKDQKSITSATITFLINKD